MFPLVTVKASRSRLQYGAVSRWCPDDYKTVRFVSSWWHVDGFANIGEEEQVIQWREFVNDCKILAVYYTTLYPIRISDWKWIVFFRDN